MSLHWAQLVHEKLAVIATFAFSQVPLQTIRTKYFVGSWPFLDKIVHDLPYEDATKALMELALYFRALDDKEGLTGYWKKVGTHPAVGTLTLRDGKTQPLSPREMSNKIIHAKKIDWDFPKEEPWIICTGEDKEKWVTATINVKDLLWMGAQLGS